MNAGKGGLISTLFIPSSQPFSGLKMAVERAAFGTKVRLHLRAGEASQLYALTFFFLSTIAMANAVVPSIQTDAQALMDFKNAADLGNHTSLSGSWGVGNPCDAQRGWVGIGCSVKGRVKFVVLENMNLTGTFPNNTLSRLGSLQVLSLRGNALTGSIPADLTDIVNLKQIYLSENRFSGGIPVSFSLSRHLNTLILSNNNLTGPIPTEIAGMPTLDRLRLENNQLSGGIPATIAASNFNVSNNVLSGLIPPNVAAKYGPTAFSGNPNLCSTASACAARGAGVPPSSAVKPLSPASSSNSANPYHASSSSSANSSPVLSSTTSKKGLSPGKIAGAVVGSIVVLIIFTLVISVICWKKCARRPDGRPQKGADAPSFYEFSGQFSGPYSAQIVPEEDNSMAKLIFVDGYDKPFSLEDLLRASAEMLGKGSLGAAYKAVMEGGHAVTVKRLRDLKDTGRRNFEHQMDIVGRLKHPNMAPLRAYYYAREEKLLVYDFYPNGSLFTCLHGKSPEQPPLDWTARLRIARGVARGLDFVHRAPVRPLHGNVKSANVFLDSAGEARLSDGGLTGLLDPAAAVARLAGYRAPEYTGSRRMSQKADVYSFGILLLELLTGRMPGQHTDAVDLPRWVNAVVRDEWTSEVFDKQLISTSRREEADMYALLKVAMECAAHNPDKRPKMSKALEDIVAIRMPMELRGHCEDISEENPLNSSYRI